MPTTKYTMAELRQGLIDALHKHNLRTVMIEVALISDVNDSLQKADELADFEKKFIINEVPRSKLMINVIPYNDICAEQPSSDWVLLFQRRLLEAGVLANIRGEWKKKVEIAHSQI